MEDQRNSAPSKKEIVVIQNIAEVDVNNAEPLLVDTQTFTIEYLDDPEGDIEVKKSPSSRDSPPLNQLNEPTIAKDGEVEHGSSSEVCLICGQCYISVQAKKRHELSHFGIKLINCKICLKYFITSTKYYQHKCIVAYKFCLCHICEKRFFNLEHLKCHEIEHTHLLPHRCDNCKQCFSNFNSKKYHICHRYLPYSMYFCQKCSRVFKKYEGLIIHYLEHLMDEVPLIEDISDSLILEHWQKFAMKEPNRYQTDNAAEKRKLDDDTDDDSSLEDTPSIKLKPDNITNSTSSLVNCRLCKQVHKNEIERLQHEIEHFTKAKPLRCTRCQKVFLLTSSYFEHGCKNEIVNVEPICNICKGGVSLSFLKTHELIHTGEVMCQNTGKSFSECNCGCSEELGTKTLTCNICKKIFQNLRCLDIHKLYHFIEDDCCGIPMIILQRLIMNANKGDDDSPLYLGTNSSEILLNDGTSLTVAPAELTLEPQNFTKSTSSNVSTENVCEICNTKCNTVYDKKLHILKHFGIKPYRCELCLRHFALSSTYYRHECEENLLGRNSHPTKNAIVDTPKVTYNSRICHLCNKIYVTLHALTRHETAHTNERPYKCFNCHRHFTQKKHICTLIKNDKEESDKAECKNCGKVFRDIMYLSIHEITHYFDGKKHLNDVPDFLPLEKP